MNFIERVKGIISEPKKNMNNISEQPMIEEAVMIIGIYAILTAIAAYIQSYKITYVFEGLDDMPSSMQSLMTVSTIVAALIAPFIIWIIVTGVIHLLSMAAGGEGKFYPQMITIVGFSMLPLIFDGIISIGIFSLIEPQTITILTVDPSGMKELYSNSYFLVSGLAGIIIYLWSTILLYFGIMSSQKLSSNSSAIIAAIPLFFNVISLIWTFRGTGIL
ncbi:MAG: Yip1 family protein [Candidatus Methanoperedens sp.]|nr:Yip1 family protein [Candidatus Methanoperedens sp.]